MAVAASATPLEVAATMASPSSTSRSTSAGAADDAPLPMPSRNPLPLSASQEAQVREVFNDRVRKLCSEEIQAFADCARNRTFSVTFACRALSRQMNGCMAAHATQAEHDRAREEWFAQRAARARERERKERRRIEQERFHRDWWGLPEKDPEVLKRELEKMGKKERIGGLTRREEEGR
ncbi:cytochrome c oxidase biogenesis protein Cmc1 like-domain-containing protein [Camillea tinctor]|nr:cytochrome c oxidase biogenesis protein Cmc1 like-domain-containing protein [Camillea tinctor]